MSDRYKPREIEPKWQATWEEQGLYDTVEDPGRPRWYALTMLPYTSGDLHTGHWYAMTPSASAARFRRMNGLTSSSQLALTPSVCRRRTRPSRITCIPRSGRIRMSSVCRANCAWPVLVPAFVATEHRIEL